MINKPFIVQRYSHGDQRPMFMRADRVPVSDPVAAQAFATYDESWDRIEFFGVGRDGQETATNEFSVVMLPRAQAGLLECVDRLNDRDVLDILTAAEAHAGDSGIRINAQTIEKARRHLRLLARDRGADVLWALMQPADAGEG